MTSSSVGTPLDFSQRDGYVTLEAAWTQTEPVHVQVETEEGTESFPLLIGVKQGMRFARSPYGYPGPSRAFFTRDHVQQYLRLAAGEGWVGTYLRCHPIHGPRLKSTIDMPDAVLHHSGDVALVDLGTDDGKSLLSGYHKNMRRDIRRASRDGIVIEITMLEDGVERFAPLYADAMDRLNARPSLRYDRNYLERFANAVGESGFFSCAILADSIIAMCMLVVTGKTCQYHLSAGAASGPKGFENGMKLALHAGLVEAAKRGAVSANLGGGVGGADDGLWRFKTRFSSRIEPYLTLRTVADRIAFEELFTVDSASAVRGDSFPPSID